MEPRLSEKEITIDLDLNSEIQLYGDSQRISRIFRILLDNAIKYSNEKSHIKVLAVDHYQGQFNLRGIDGTLIQVIDSGVGIKEKDIRNLFKPFFRAEDVKTLQGTGLGLSIAKELILLHQGAIFVESEYGKGSTFSIFLPRIESKQ